jgi:hypothetical protein
VLYWLIATMIAAVAAFFVLGRYRYPIALLLIPFAGAGHGVHADPHVSGLASDAHAPEQLW